MKLHEFSRIKWERARELRKRGAYREAEEELKEALEEQPDHPLLKLSLAMIYIKEEKYLEAKVLAEEVLSQDPSDSKALYVMGEILLQGKRFNEALLYFQKAAHKDQSAFLKLRIARTLREMCRYQEALDILDNELIRDRENPLFLKEKALILNRMEHYKEALELYERLRELFPQDQFIKKEVIRLKGLKQAPEKTIKELEITLNMPSQKDNAQLRGFLAQKLKDEGRLEEAAYHFEKALELQPQNSFFLKQAGYCYYHLKRYDRAIKALGQALRMNPRDYYVKTTLGKIYSKTGNLKEFISLLEDIFSEHPDQVSLIGKIRRLRKELEVQDSDDRE